MFRPLLGHLQVLWENRSKSLLHTIGFNPLNAELNSMCHLLALLGARHIFHVSGLRVNIPPPQIIFLNF